jgi:hypothetical protein
VLCARLCHPDLQDTQYTDNSGAECTGDVMLKGTHFWVSSAVTPGYLQAHNLVATGIKAFVSEERHGRVLQNEYASCAWRDGADMCFAYTVGLGRQTGWGGAEMSTCIDEVSTRTPYQSEEPRVPPVPPFTGARQQAQQDLLHPAPQRC